MDEEICKPCESEVKPGPVAELKLLGELDERDCTLLDDGNELVPILLVGPPFDAEGTDLELLEVGFVVDTGVVGLWPPGTTREYSSMLFAPPHASPRRSRQG